MKIIRKIRPSKVRVTPITKTEPTDNKYVLKVNDKPQINTSAIEQWLLRYPSPKVDGYSGVRRFLNDKSKGYRKWINILDLNIEVSEEQLEQYLLDGVSVFLYKEPGKFPLKDFPEKDTPDDSPPNDQGLEDLNMTTEDFKL